MNEKDKQDLIELARRQGEVWQNQSILGAHANITICDLVDAFEEEMKEVKRLHGHLVSKRQRLLERIWELEGELEIR